MIRVLVVDDSALMRRQLSQILTDAGDFEIALARNGADAVAMNESFLPDVITLDINMPEMDGITALSLIMAERPVPVVMVSSLTEKGALATFEALNLGAVDYIAKPGGTISLRIDDIRVELVAKVRAAAKARLKTRRNIIPVPSSPVIKVPPPSPTAAPIRRGVARDGIVIIGVSTGGPRTLEDILPHLPEDLPWPVIVAQHMPPAFTLSFAQRLDTQCKLKVVENSTPMPLAAGTIYIGKGGADTLVTTRSGTLTVLPKPEDNKYLWHPSVELLGRSVLEHYDPKRIVAVMLTGMGFDGAEAFTEIKNQGGRTIAESEESAVVFGMPAELIDKGGASLILPADKIATQITQWVG